VQAASAILIVSSDASDAEMVRKLLQVEFGNVYVSVDSVRFVDDFGHRMPQVLVLAFQHLEQAERYFLTLYRRLPQIHRHQYRVIALCEKDELRQAAQMCIEQSFDDYVLFWPMNHDARRLPVAVHRALREITATQQEGPSADEFAALSRDLSGLEEMLDHQVSELVRSEIKPALPSAHKSLEPIDQQQADFKQPLKKPLASAQALVGLADKIRPVILVVDDDEIQRVVIRQILESQPYRLQFAASGIDALQMLGEARHHLVLMDIQMPGMDGLETTTRLKAEPQWKGIAVIIMSADSSEKAVRDSVAVGACGFLVKPVERERLIAAVTKALAEAGLSGSS
jgi:CheY-like chemotaxis protein